MPIVKKYCPTCNKRADLSSQYKVGSLTFQLYNCGHSSGRRDLTVKSFDDFISQDGKTPFPFQKEGAVFAINANAKCLITDEMGLGKTIQVLMVAKSDPKELTPLLWACKSRLKIQAAREITRWCGEDWLAQVIDSENEFIMPGAKAYIVSYDMLWRFKDIESFVKRTKIKMIVLDEVQHIKNTGSKRTQGVRAVCKGQDHIIGLSGTPIKNNGIEYFPILNILYPEKFPTEANFAIKFLQSYFNGYKMQYAGLRSPEHFKDYTKDFIIRRTRAEVLPQLPAISREFRFSELGDAVEDAYKAEFIKFRQYYNYDGMDDTGGERSSNILAYLTKMRHLTGIAKVNPVVEFTEDFIHDTDRKLIIFAHHEDVRKTLKARLEELLIQDTQTWGMRILHLEAGAGQTIIDQFKLPENRIMIASTLSAGEGLNLQFCSDAIMMERQWNPANEEQAEGRIVRIGQTANKLTCTYMIAVGTVDEMFAEIVEKKRSYSSSILDGKEIDWNQSSLLQELAEVLAATGGKRWGI